MPTDAGGEALLQAAQGRWEHGQRPCRDWTSSSRGLCSSNWLPFSFSEHPVAVLSAVMLTP